MQDAGYIEPFDRNREGLGQRRLDFLVEQRHDAVQNVDQIEQHVLALIDHRQTLARMLFGLPDARDLEPHACPERLALRMGEHRIQAFEQVVREYKLSPDQYLRSTRLREWARRNKNSKYIPEPLLEAWGFEIESTL